jgi:Zn-finger protein
MSTDKSISTPPVEAVDHNDITCNYFACHAGLGTGCPFVANQEYSVEAVELRELKNEIRMIVRQHALCEYSLYNTEDKATDAILKALQTEITKARIEELERHRKRLTAPSEYWENRIAQLKGQI